MSRYQLLSRSRSMIAGSVATVLASLATGSVATAATWIVRPDGSGDFPTIQGAVTGAVDGDVILLTDGTFRGDGNRDVDLQGKSLSIASQSGDPGSCLVDCEGSAVEPHRALTISQAPTSQCEVANVTFRGGEAPGPDGYGGAIYADGGSLRIVECRFDTGHAEFGGGVFQISGDLDLQSCEFVDNRSANVGGGVVCLNGTARIAGCTFIANIGDHGGGAVVVQEGEFVIDACTFHANAPDAIFAVGPGPPGNTDLSVSRTVIAFGIGVPVACIETDVDITCTDIFGNTGGDWVGCIANDSGRNGNISDDPLFCDPATGNLYIASSSPCAPAQSPDCGLIGAWPVGCDATPVQASSWGAIKWRLGASDTRPGARTP
ncbi:MAG: hypothetical protein R3E12_02855 [Candidatus Eisenbacteria bacterium]|uniref:Right handed beta helix domain-containing protein n=1 Tax=Eiseniibacteriota bacterium TaxID=2212470 RepID=A0A956RQY2_UNCEI|nr:hypothetical protein [Candidatus Eisenbacteria bacterium]